MDEAHRGSASAVPAAQTNPSEERRRSPRIRMEQPLRLRGSEPAAGAFEDVCKTVDASRGGLYFTSERDFYRPGMALTVVFPYSPQSAPEEYYDRPAEIVRATPLPGGHYGVALQFLDTAGAFLESSGTKAGASSAEDGPPLVLLVEKNPQKSGALRNTLAGGGYEVKSPPAGSVALAELRRRSPAVMIVVLSEPADAALDFCHIVKRDPRLRRIPLVVVLEQRAVADYRAARELGAVLCIPAPIQPDRLLRALGILVPVSSPMKPSLA
jgi:CheY-like chemotaxis protein